MLDRIARTLFHRKMLSKREREVLRSSRLMLCRNFDQHLDNNFRFLCLEQFFLSEKSGKLDIDVVPDAFNPRALPGFPAKLLYDVPATKLRQKSRLASIVDALYDDERRPTAASNQFRDLFADTDTSTRTSTAALETTTVASTEKTSEESSSAQEGRLQCDDLHASTLTTLVGNADGEQTRERATTSEEALIDAHGRMHDCRMK